MSNALQINKFLYSHQAGDDLKRTVARIQGKHDSFATDFMTFAGSSGPDPAVERVEAWRDPDTGLWKIQRLTRVPGGGVNQEAVAQNVCFFDALHYCARFQAAAEEKGGLPVPAAGERWAGVPHYRAAAEAAGQAIDEDGAVHPCAHGQVLTNGWFGEKAWADAAKTKGEEFALAPPAQNLAGGMIGGLLAPGAAAMEKATITLAVRKHETISRFQAVLNAGERMLKNLEKIMDARFHTDFAASSGLAPFAVGLSVMTLGIMPAWQYVAGDSSFGIKRSFMIFKDKFQRAAAGLPDCPVKSLTQEFAKATEFAFWMERAARVYQDCREEKRRPSAALKAVCYLERAVAAAGLNPCDLGRLKDEYLSGGIRCGTFFGKLKSEWNTNLAKKLGANRDSIAKGPS